MYDLALGETFAIKPQEVRQLLRVTAICFLLGWLLRVNQHDFATLPFAERID